jgi:H+-translocating NAD(P) transhydrogenase subunit beta
MQSAYANWGYLLAAILFIAGLKGLTHPRTAVRGNFLGALGMLVAVLTALVFAVRLNWVLIFAGLLIGSAVGAILARRIQMTAMPQLVGLFNGFGGGASFLVAAVALTTSVAISEHRTSELQQTIAAALSAIIGMVTLTGSLAACAKLQGIVRKALRFPGQRALNGILLVVLAMLAIQLVKNPGDLSWFWTLAFLAAVFGLLLVAPIGGADMPVVIAVLNSYSGLAACATGFVLSNNVLIVSGALVGASGMILTRIMCRAMNRSFRNVILGVPVAAADRRDQEEIYAGKVKSTSAEEAAMVLEAARRVVIVPGYGMAVSQAQYAVRDLTQLLEERDISVEFAIHPVAGRMPGHMNVLLAEADIPYDQMRELEVVNPTFDQVDVCVVIGANDVVNPDARTNANSPIAGMPILNVDRAKTVIVVKRSLSPGFAGIPNPLFAADNTLMLFDDGKAAVTAVNAALKGER